MKKTLKLILMTTIIASFFLIGSAAVYAADYGYDADKALTYADKHYQEDFDYEYGKKVKADCVKFVRSCVEAGGVPKEANRTWGYTPEDYVNYIVDNGWADYYELQLTEHTDPWVLGRYFIDPQLNSGKLSPGDVLVYNCTKPGCTKPCFHLELVHDTEGEVTSYAHNKNKGPSYENDTVITFPHSKTDCGAEDEYIEIGVLHFKEDPYLFCPHESVKYEVTKKASFSTFGEKTGYCTVCNETTVKSIPAVKKYYLSSTAYTYNGKSRKPAVVMWDTYGKNLYETTSTSKNGFKAVYSSGRKDVGKYTVKVTLVGPEYSGTKTFSFKMNPKGTSISKVTAAKKGFTVKWKKQSAKMSKARITGYQIRYSTSSKMTKAKTVTVKGYSKTSKKITKLSKKKTYYVQVRTYKGDCYSSWSKAKKVKTK